MIPSSCYYNIIFSSGELNLLTAGSLSLAFLGEDEWKLLYCMANKTKKGPEKPYTVKEAAGCLGRLGGPKRAPSDGLPGAKTIWLGLMKLYILLACRECLA
jgi:hypothetical protein